MVNFGVWILLSLVGFSARGCKISFSEIEENVASLVESKETFIDVQDAIKGRCDANEAGERVIPIEDIPRIGDVGKSMTGLFIWDENANSLSFKAPVGLDCASALIRIDPVKSEAIVLDLRSTNFYDEAGIQKCMIEESLTFVIVSRLLKALKLSSISVYDTSSPDACKGVHLSTFSYVLNGQPFFAATADQLKPDDRETFQAFRELHENFCDMAVPDLRNSLVGDEERKDSDDNGQIDVASLNQHLLDEDLWEDSQWVHESTQLDPFWLPASLGVIPQDILDRLSQPEESHAAESSPVTYCDIARKAMQWANSKESCSLAQSAETFFLQAADQPFIPTSFALA